MTQERDLKLFIRRVDHKCTDSQGEWDGTWDETYEYVIYDGSTGDEVTEWGGYPTRKAAREAGEKALTKLKERK